ncbi:MAG: hypothetical protein OIN85_07445 [Candidatus Methanoperedens sp.]|nr:hypothetical protein [Candidatus Methanoperedens sp.]
MNAKFTLALVALVSVGVFALPSTVALFAGQHSFVNIDATGNQIDCVKCHGDVNAELTSVASAPHVAFTCEMCHRIEAGKASGDAVIYSLAYTDGTNNRTLVMSETDYQSGLFPASIPNNGTVTITGSLAFAVSPSSHPGVDATLTPILSHGSPSKASPIELLNADGSPKDTNATTKYTGVRLSSVKAAQWNMTGTYPDIKLDGLGSEVVNPGTTYHAASLVSCMECHAGEAPPGHEQGALSDCSNCHYGGGSLGGQQMRNLWAGGFGLTAKTNDTGVIEAHTNFQTTNDSITRQKDGISNGACVACHTHVAVDITYRKAMTYTFDANVSSGGSWTLSGFSATGEAISNSTG